MKYFYDLHTLDDIKKSYKKLVRQLHPDIVGEAFTAQFQEMQEEKTFAEWKLSSGYDTTGPQTYEAESKSGNAQARREEQRKRYEDARKARRSAAAKKAAETRRRNAEAEARRKAQEAEAQRRHAEYMRQQEEIRKAQEREEAERLRRKMEELNRIREAKEAEERRKAQEAEEFRRRAEAEARAQQEAKAKANNQTNNTNNQKSEIKMKKTSFFSNVTNIADLTAQFQNLMIQHITDAEKLNAIRLEYLKLKAELENAGTTNANDSAQAETKKAIEPWLKVIDYSEKSFVVTGFGEPEDMDKGHQYKYIERYFLARFEKACGKRCSVNVNLRNGLRGIVISKKAQAEAQKLIDKLNKNPRPEYDPNFKKKEEKAA